MEITYYNTSKDTAETKKNFEGSKMQSDQTIQQNIDSANL